MQSFLDGEAKRLLKKIFYFLYLYLRYGCEVHSIIDNIFDTYDYKRSGNNLRV